jgi:hypothetical protein
MDLEKLQQKLLAVARQDTVSDRVPYAFEQRVLAYLAGRVPVDLAAWWGQALWRAAAVCLFISIMLSFWSFFTVNGGGPVTLETAVLAAVEELSETW